MPSAAALSALLLLAAACTSQATTPAGEVEAATAEGAWETIEITARSLGATGADGAPVPLTIGTLRYAGGIVLTAPDARFGGFSGLRLMPGEQRLLALSDRAAWLSADYQINEYGAITGLSHAAMTDLTGNGDSPVSGAEADSEGLEVAEDGSAIVSFERRHRLDRYARAEDGTWRHEETLLDGETVGNLPGNGSLESVIDLGDGRLLTISEEAREAGPLRPGWAGAGDDWIALSYRPAPDFSLTDMAYDPATGEIYAVERAFSPTRGVRARLTRFGADEIAPGALIEPEELARLNAFHGVDNMEGIDVQRLPGGQLMLYLVSDDNFSIAQRTILMSWAVTDRAGPAE